MIFVKSQRSAVRVFASVQRFLTRRLRLVVNEQKSRVGPALGCEFLGFTFVGSRVTIQVTSKKRIAFKRRIKELTGRSRGISMTRRLTDLARYVRGWIGYFGLARQFDEFVELDGWIRRRIRMCYWKQWRHPRTKVKKPSAARRPSDPRDQARDQSQRLLADVSHTRHALRDAQHVAGAARTHFAQATLDRTRSPSRNRLVRTRMLGGVGAGTGNRPGYTI